MPVWSLRDEINRGADEKRLDGMEYIALRCLFERSELLREGPTDPWLA